MYVTYHTDKYTMFIYVRIYKAIAYIKTRSIPACSVHVYIYMYSIIKQKKISEISYVYIWRIDTLGMDVCDQK